MYLKFLLLQIQTTKFNIIYFRQNINPIQWSYMGFWIMFHAKAN